MHTIKPIRTEADDDWALAEIDLLMDAEPGTQEGDRLDVLVTLVEVKVLGRKSRVSEVLGP